MREAETVNLIAVVRIRRTDSRDACTALSAPLREGFISAPDEQSLALGRKSERVDFRQTASAGSCAAPLRQTMHALQPDFKHLESAPTVACRRAYAVQGVHAVIVGRFTTAMRKSALEQNLGKADTTSCEWHRSYVARGH